MLLNAVHGKSEIIDGSAQKAIWLMDKQRKTVFKSTEWGKLEDISVLNTINKFNTDSVQGSLKINADLILHWQLMHNNFAIAPGGTLYVVESNSLEKNAFTFSNVLNEFSIKCKLTAREKEIVSLVFKGYPNSRIASKLYLSEGTVRNHRHRLYYKLNITSERELFTQFLEEIIHDDTSSIELTAMH